MPGMEVILLLLKSLCVVRIDNALSHISYTPVKLEVDKKRPLGIDVSRFPAMLLKYRCGD